MLITTCPRCQHTDDADAQATRIDCRRCGYVYDPFDDEAEDPWDHGPDYGGALDALGNVHSDADPGL